ncbi:hypothetical protein, partial [uncultured Senegalimassilia sp.]|uniref:hypothetical protein n=1 Tax=uncultured Senegalimassilia sp. TaxID=1714350 RepID=UPI00267253ED
MGFDNGLKPDMDDADAASDQSKGYQRHDDCQNYAQRLHLCLLSNMIETNKIGLFGGFCGRDSGIGPAQR